MLNIRNLNNITHTTSVRKRKWQCIRLSDKITNESYIVRFDLMYLVGLSNLVDKAAALNKKCSQ